VWPGMWERAAPLCAARSWRLCRYGLLNFHHCRASSKFVLSMHTLTASAPFVPASFSQAALICSWLGAQPESSASDATGMTMARILMRTAPPWTTGAQFSESAEYQRDTVSEPPSPPSDSHRPHAVGDALSVRTNETLSRYHLSHRKDDRTAARFSCVALARSRNASCANRWLNSLHSAEPRRPDWPQSLRIGARPGTIADRQKCHRTRSWRCWKVVSIAFH